MRWTQTLIPTQKENPADAQIISHQLMVRAGLVRQLAAGTYDFLRKDAYSIHESMESLDRTYDGFYRAYEKIFTRCGIPYVVVEAESGPIGGSASHEFMAQCSAGEDTIVSSDKGNYSANVEKAEVGERPWTFGGDQTGGWEKVHTPGRPGIEDGGKVLQ